MSMTAARRTQRSSALMALHRPGAKAAPELA